MTLLASIALWQKEAMEIRPPSGTDRLAAVGGLLGPAFFPEGFGLSDVTLHQNERPSIIAIGHNFGCQAYRNEIQPAGREDDKAAWRNLDGLLSKAGSNPKPGVFARTGSSVFCRQQLDWTLPSEA